MGGAGATSAKIDADILPIQKIIEFFISVP